MDNQFSDRVTNIMESDCDNKKANCSISVPGSYTSEISDSLLPTGLIKLPQEICIPSTSLNSDVVHSGAEILYSDNRSESVVEIELGCEEDKDALYNDCIENMSEAEANDHDLSCSFNKTINSEDIPVSRFEDIESHELEMQSFNTSDSSRDASFASCVNAESESVNTSFENNNSLPTISTSLITVYAGFTKCEENLYKPIKRSKEQDYKSLPQATSDDESFRTSQIGQTTKSKDCNKTEVTNIQITKSKHCNKTEETNIQPKIAFQKVNQIAGNVKEFKQIINTQELNQTVNIKKLINSKCTEELHNIKDTHKIKNTLESNQNDCMKELNYSVDTSELNKSKHVHELNLLSQKVNDDEKVKSIFLEYSHENFDPKKKNQNLIIHDIDEISNKSKVDQIVDKPDSKEINTIQELNSLPQVHKFAATSDLSSTTGKSNLYNSTDTADSNQISETHESMEITNTPDSSLITGNSDSVEIAEIPDSSLVTEVIVPLNIATTPDSSQIKDLPDLDKIINTPVSHEVTDAMILNQISNQQKFTQITTQDIQINTQKSIEKDVKSFKKTNTTCIVKDSIKNDPSSSTSSYSHDLHDYHKTSNITCSNLSCNIIEETQSPSSSTDIKSSPSKNKLTCDDLHLTTNSEKYIAISPLKSSSIFQDSSSAIQSVPEPSSNLDLKSGFLEENYTSSHQSLYPDLIESHMDVGEYTTIETTEDDVEFKEQNIDLESNSEDSNFVTMSSSYLTPKSQGMESDSNSTITDNFQLNSVDDDTEYSSVKQVVIQRNLKLLPNSDADKTLFDETNKLVHEKSIANVSISPGNEIKDIDNSLTCDKLAKYEIETKLPLTKSDISENFIEPLEEVTESDTASSCNLQIDEDICCLKENKIETAEDLNEMEQDNVDCNSVLPNSTAPETSNIDNQVNESSFKILIKKEPVNQFENEMSPKDDVLETFDRSTSEVLCQEDFVKKEEECRPGLDSIKVEIENEIKKEKTESNFIDKKEKIMLEESFDWDRYLKKTNSEPAPPTAFLHVERSLETGIEPNQCLEVLVECKQEDDVNESKKWLSFWPAKVVTSCGNLLRLRYIGTKTSSKLTAASLEFWCDLSSSKIKPIGWSHEHQISMNLPPDFSPEIEPDIFDEQSLKDLEAVPEEAFCTSRRELYNRVVEGCLIEILDPQSPYEVTVMRVLKNIGGRLLLTELQSSENYEDDKPIWLFFLDKRIKPYGWTKEQGEPFRYKQNFLELLEDLQYKSSEKSLSFLSTLSSLLTKHSLEPGMYLEAILPTTMQSIHAATVSRVLDDTYFEMKIDDYTWITTIEDPLIMQCGFADDMCLDLVPPGMNYGQFTWDSLVANSGGKKVPNGLFIPYTTASDVGFEEGQKLEIANPDNSDRICIATIERVLQHILLLKLDSNPDYMFFRAITDMDMFPVGWAQSHSYPIFIPLWYGMRSRNPSFSQNEEPMKSPLESNNLITDSEKSSCTSHNSMWCPRLYINHWCYPGPYLSKNKVSKMSQSVGPGPVLLVLRDVISMTINAAYIPTRVLRELQHLRRLNSSWQSILMKAKFKRHTLKACVNIPSAGRDIETFLMEFSRILMSCPNLWSYENIGEICSYNCNKQSLPLITNAGAASRGKGGVRCTYRRKKGGKKRLFYPIKSSATNQDENPEEFCDPDEGEGDDGISESEGESRPSSPATLEVQRKLKPKRILSSLEITMNDSRGVDVKERSTKRSRGEFEVPEVSNTPDEDSTFSNRKRTRTEGERETHNGIYGLETASVNTDPLHWSIEDVEKWVMSQPDISHHAVRLKEHEVDGRALLLINLPSLVHHLGLPHPIAVTLAQHICRVKMAHFTYFYPKYEKNGTR